MASDDPTRATPTQEPDRITRAAAARMLGGCSIRTVDRRIESGELTAYRFGTRSVRLDRAEVEARIVRRDDEKPVTNIADHIEKALASAPPLTDEQRARIARLLVTDGAA